MPLLRGLLRLVGWLLTPLVAWAASFVGSAIGSLGSGLMGSGRGALWLAMATGGASALVAAWAWLRLLRRSPRLQETLAVAPDGIPLAALEEPPPPPPPAP